MQQIACPRPQEAHVSSVIPSVSYDDTQVHDFVGRDEMNGLQAFLNTITSLPNHDSCEDVAGGLLVSYSDLIWLTAHP